MSLGCIGNVHWRVVSDSLSFGGVHFLILAGSVLHTVWNSIGTDRRTDRRTASKSGRVDLSMSHNN